MEMLMTGTTTINETWWFQTESARVVRDLGIRAVLSEMIREVEFTQKDPKNTERQWNPAIAEKAIGPADRMPGRVDTVACGDPRDQCVRPYTHGIVGTGRSY